jgi:hypothetical protein
MRYPPAAGFEGMHLSQTSVIGPYVPPGTYRARLSVDGVTEEQTFRIVMDPRLEKVAASDLVAQSALARRIHQRFGEALAAVGTIRSLTRDVDDRMRQTNTAAVAAEAARLKTKLADIEERLYQTRSIDAHSGAQYGARLIDRLGHLLNSYVLGSDAPPTDQSVEVFDALSRDIQVQLDRLRDVVQTDVPRLNQLLERARVKPVTVTPVL